MTKIAVKGEPRFVDFDAETGRWCVFGKLSGVAYSTWSDRSGAEEDLEACKRLKGVVSPDPDHLHICDYLEYRGCSVRLVYPGSVYQRWTLVHADETVSLQVVMFCPYCGQDFREDLLWQIPGRPQENDIFQKAQQLGAKKAKKKRKRSKG